jgi:drug/metabolite transporter (DMT)-like permease
LKFINSYKAHLLLILVTIISGANYTVIKNIIPDQMSANALIFIRSAMGLVFFTLLNHFLAPKVKIEKQDRMPIFISGLLGVTLNQIFFYNGMGITKPINGSIINLINPITVVVFSAFFLKEKLGFYQIFAILIALSGALLLIDFNSFYINQSTFWGDVMIFLNALCFGMYLVLVTPLVRKYNPYLIAKWNFGTAFCCLLPLAFTDLGLVQWYNFEQSDWLSLTYILLLTTLLVYFLNYYLPQITSPQTIGMYIYFHPFLAAIIAICAGKDEITFKKIISGFLILGGIYLSQYDKRIKSRKQNF